MLRRFICVKIFLRPCLDLDVAHSTQVFQLHRLNAILRTDLDGLDDTRSQPSQQEPCIRGEKLHRIASAWLTFHHIKRFVDELQVVLAEGQRQSEIR